MNRRTTARLSLFALSLLIVIAVGCQFNPVGDDPAMTPTGLMQRAVSAVTGNATLRMAVQVNPIDLSSVPRAHAALRPGAKAGTAQVTFKLIGIKVNGTVPEAKTVPVDSNGEAAVTFDNVPTGPTVGQVLVDGAEIAGYTDFNGAKQIEAGANEMKVNPAGSAFKSDLLAQVLIAANESDDVKNAMPPNFATLAKGVIDTMNLSNDDGKLPVRVLNAVLEKLGTPTMVKLAANSDGTKLQGYRNGVLLWERVVAEIWQSSELWNADPNGLLVETVLRHGVDGFGYVQFRHQTTGISMIGRFEALTGRLLAFCRHDGPIGPAIVMKDTSIIVGGSLTTLRTPILFKWSGQNLAVTPRGTESDQNLVWKKVFTQYAVESGADVPAVEAVTFDGGTLLTVQVRDPIVKTRRTWRFTATDGNGVEALPGLRLMYAQAVPGNQKVDLNWTGVTGATGYQIAWAAGQIPGTGAQTQAVTGTSWSHTGLINNTTYFYIVTPQMPAGTDVTRSGVLQAIPTGTIPSGPSDVRASVGSGSITLTWSAVDKATSYNLYFSTTTGVTPSTGSKRAFVRSPYTHIGLTNGTQYYYVLTAVGGAGESAPSPQVSQVPRPSPTNPRTESLDGGVRVAWDYMDTMMQNGGLNHKIFFTTSEQALAVPIYDEYRNVYPASLTTLPPWSSITRDPIVDIPFGPNGQLAYMQPGMPQPALVYDVNRQPIIVPNGQKIYDANGQPIIINGQHYTLVTQPTGVRPGNGLGWNNEQPTDMVQSPSWKEVLGFPPNPDDPSAAGQLWYSGQGGGNTWTGTTTGTGVGTGIGTTPTYPPVYRDLSGLANGQRRFFVVCAEYSTYSGNTTTYQRTFSPPVPGTAHPKPANLQAVPLSAGRSVQLTWTPIPDAVGYNVYRDGARVAIGTATTPFTDSGLVDGQPYFYQVGGLFHDSDGPLATGTTIRPVTGTFAPPQTVVAAAGNQRVSLFWSAVPGAEKYNVYWSERSGITTTNSNRIADLQPGYINTETLNGTRYYFRVSAINGTLESDLSTEVSAVPSTSYANPAVTNLSVTAIDAASATIAWNAATTAPAKYWVIRNGSPIGETTSALTFNDPNMVMDQTFGYQIAPAYTSGVTAPTASAVVTVPMWLTATSLGGDDGEDEALGVCALSDGGWVAVGRTNSANGGTVARRNGTYGSDGFIVRYNAAGQIVWAKTLGSTDSDEFVSACELPGGTIAVLGVAGTSNGDVTATTSDYNARGWLVKLDANGTIVSQKRVPMIYPRAVVSAGSGDVICLGSGYDPTSVQPLPSLHDVRASTKFPNGQTDFTIVRIGSDNNQQYVRYYGGSKYDEVARGVLTSDGGLIVAGTTTSNDGDVSGLHDPTSTPSGDTWVIKVEATTGNLQWKRCIGGTGNDLAYDVIADSSGGAWAIGRTEATDGDMVGGPSAYNRVWMAPISSAGTVGAVQFVMPPGNENNSNCFAVAPDGAGHFVAAWIRSSNYGQNVWVSNTDTDWVVARLNSVGTLSNVHQIYRSGADEQYPYISGYSSSYYYCSPAVTTNGRVVLCGRTQVRLTNGSGGDVNGFVAAIKPFTSW